MKLFNKCEVKTRLKVGDEVVVITGKNLGQRGKITDLDKKRGRVTIEGVNVMKKHQRPSMSNQSGGIVDKACPINLSNVMYWDDKTKGPSRIGYKTEAGKKVRFAKKSGSILG